VLVCRGTWAWRVLRTMETPLSEEGREQLGWSVENITKIIVAVEGGELCGGNAFIGRDIGHFYNVPVSRWPSRMSTPGLAG
jgi:hypothetical protein